MESGDRQTIGGADKITPTDSLNRDPVGRDPWEKTCWHHSIVHVAMLVIISRVIGDGCVFKELARLPALRYFF